MLPPPGNLRGLLCAAAMLVARPAVAFAPTPYRDGVLVNLTAAGAGTPACTWGLTPDGLYSSAGAAGLCLTVAGAGGNRGSVVYLAPCGAANATASGQQSWAWVGAEMDGGILFAGQARDEECITGVDPATGPPSQLVLAPCTFAPWQQLTSDADGNGTIALQDLPSGPPLILCAPSHA